jgi:DNA-binding MarR family transcriptional regulator
MAGGQPAVSVIEALERIAYGAVAVTTRALAAVGVELTFPQWRVLVVVGNRPEGLSVSEVAERLGSELSPTSRLVARMARRGYVTLEKDPADRRVTRVVLTEPGQTLRRAVVAHRRMLIEAVVTDVVDDGEVSPGAVEDMRRLGEGFRRYR